MLLEREATVPGAISRSLSEVAGLRKKQVPPLKKEQGQSRRCRCR